MSLLASPLFPPYALMSHVKPRGATARPLHKRRRECRCDDRATVGAKPQRRRSTSSHSRVHACPCFRLGLSRSEDGRRPCGRPQSTIGNSPCRGLRSRRCTRFIFTGPCPGAGSLKVWLYVPLAPFGRPALLGRSTGGGDLATDGPDEAGELARDRGDGHGLELALADQRPVAPVQAALRLPGDLANC